jgi:UDP-N-acetyl-D-mannosaminuronic acid dehydrogenase
VFNTISLIGLGYIGLPTATLFASRKKQVIGVDVSKHVVDTINSGRIHIVEPELDILVHAAVTEGFLRATLRPEPADAFLIAVPTPFQGDHEPDLKFVQAAAESIAPVLKRGDLVVLESTSPVGSTDQLARWLAALRPDLSFPQHAGEQADVQVAYCPERVLPGKVVHELVTNDRIIGGMTSKASQMAIELYRCFVEGECIVTDARTAEMCKLTENSFRDVNIAFANELSLICNKLGINVWELIRLANRHPRVNILQPGPGVGGHCIAVDPWFIVHSAPDEARLIHTARQVNDDKPRWVIEQVRLALEALPAGEPARIAVLGLAFKPNIDDLRESPAMHIAEALRAEGHTLLLVEPHIDAVPPSLGDLALVPAEQAVHDADIVLVLVAHREFNALRASLNAHRCVIDAVGITSISA